MNADGTQCPETGERRHSVPWAGLAAILLACSMVCGCGGGGSNQDDDSTQSLEWDQGNWDQENWR